MDTPTDKRQPPSEAAATWELSLDQSGTAADGHLRWALRAAAAIAVMTGIVTVFGGIPLAGFPQFTTFHATFILIADAITGFLLLGQFHYRRLPFYLILSGAYLFSSLITIPFVLSFPGALLAQDSVIGGRQSAIWVWHFWHILFPALVLLSMLVHTRYGERKVAQRQLPAAVAAMVASVMLLVAAVTLAVSVFHEQLPVLIDVARHPLTTAFYFAGGTAAALTLAALVVAWQRGRERSILYLWLSVVLVAFLGDVAASLGAHARYTVGWYFGRVEAMIAASVLLPVFVGEINLLYRQIAATMGKLASTNSELQQLVAEKDKLLGELQRSEEQVRHLAYHDPLTDLPNRRLLLDRFRQALAQARHFRRSLAVMFLDLDHFKEINDKLGHDVGDELLKEVASRLECCLRSGDTISRLGGDEFIILLTEISRPEDAALVAEKAIALLAIPFSCMGHTLEITTSIGIAIYAADGADDEIELMKKADIAMYQAKAEGRNRYRFYVDNEASRGARLKLISAGRGNSLSQ